jgi:hypothetical protein
MSPMRVTLPSCVTICNKVVLHGEELSAPRPNPKGGGPPLLVSPRLLFLVSSANTGSYMLSLRFQVKVTSCSVVV